MSNRKSAGWHEKHTGSETDPAAVWVPVSKLKAWAKNPRKNDKAVEKVAESIRTFGFGAPLLARKANGEIIAGHTRLRAAVSLGLDVVPVRYLDLDESKAHLLALADNKLGEIAQWDDAVLGSVLADLKAQGAELESSGFADRELAKLVAEVTTLDLDEVPGPPAEPITKLGDLWVLGKHRLVCGSSTSRDVVDLALGGAHASICLTDPPYGLGDTTSEKNNYRSYADTAENLRETLDGFLPIARNVADVVVLTPGNANVFKYPEPSWTMAWFTPAGVGSGPWGFCCWQPILCYGKDPKLARGNGRHPDALVHTESSENFGHPCTKPIGFWSWLLERTSDAGDVVFEPFCGSGTTIIACERLGRVCCAVELDPAYCDVIIARWEALTGKKAERVDGQLREA